MKKGHWKQLDTAGWCPFWFALDEVNMKGLVLLMTVAILLSFCIACSSVLIPGGIQPAEGVPTLHTIERVQAKANGLGLWSASQPIPAAEGVFVDNINSDV